MLLEERVRLSLLRLCDRAKLRAEVGNFNGATKRIETHIITELNSLMYAVAYVTTERMRMLKKRKERRTEEPSWKRRIKQSIETWGKISARSKKPKEGTRDWSKEKENNWIENTTFRRKALCTFQTCWCRRSRLVQSRTRDMMRNFKGSRKISSSGVTRNFSMRLWVERKVKRENNLTQLKQLPSGEWYGQMRSLTIGRSLRLSKLSRSSVQ